MPKYMTIGQMKDANKCAFHLTSGSTGEGTANDLAGVIWDGRRFVYREHFADHPVIDVPDEGDVEISLGEMEKKWGRDILAEWRHANGCGHCGE